MVTFDMDYKFRKILLDSIWIGLEASWLDILNFSLLNVVENGSKNWRVTYVLGCQFDTEIKEYKLE